MANTIDLYTGDGTTVLFSVTFPYISKSDVEVTVNGISTSDFTFANATTIEFNTPPNVGDSIAFIRQTDISQSRTVFASGSPIRASDLNQNNQQLLFSAQETNNIAAASDALSTAAAAAGDAGNALNAATIAVNDASNALSTANAAAVTAGNAVTTANSATATANNAVAVASGVASLSRSAVEAAAILINASLSIGQAGTVPFGVGPFVPDAPVITGISQRDYNPIHAASGSFI